MGLNCGSPQSSEPETHCSDQTHGALYDHHKQALPAYWKDREINQRLIQNRTDIDISETDRMLCKLAVKRILNQQQTHEYNIQELQASGMDDRAILDTVQVIAYSCFANRLVLDWVSTLQKKR